MKTTRITTNKRKDSEQNKTGMMNNITINEKEEDERIRNTGDTTRTDKEKKHTRKKNELEN